MSEHGENRLAAESHAGALRLLGRQFASPLVLILVLGACISAIIQEWTEAGTILAIVLGSTLLSFSQEYRAGTAVKRLRERLALTVIVLRDGKSESRNASEIVPGDVILLSAGNLIPADGVVLDTNDFLVSQAALTGKSFPVEKSPGVTAADASLPQRTNAVFLGTSVRSGTARILVTQTGRDTEYGKIAKRLSSAEQETDFAQGIRQFGYLLTRVMMFIVMFVVVVNLLLHRPPLQSLLFAVALAVGMTPELLPAIVSVTLAVGARRMAAVGVIVRHVESIENLGTADILCTDKTGTLTSGVVQLDAALDCNEQNSQAVLNLAVTNSRLETGIVNPLDQAIIAAGETTVSAPTKVDEIPYDFVRRRMTIVVEDEADAPHHQMITKDAFDNVLQCCNQRMTADGPKPLDEISLNRLGDFYRSKGDQGYRVLALATKRLPARSSYDRDDETGMILEGLLLFYDPLKPDIEQVLQQFHDLGIRIKLITGDNRHVAAHVGASVGFNASNLLTGEQLSQTRTEALWTLPHRLGTHCDC